MSHAGSDRSFLGHPRGLAVIAFTEGWISFSYYGMQSLLALYLTTRLLRPGHVEHVLGFRGFQTAMGWLYGPLFGQKLAAAMVGLYAALVFATPILGGLLADRLLGRTRTIVLGCVLLSAGHLLMGFEASVLLALACLVAGMGCAGIIQAQVGALYRPDDQRRADAYQIFTASVSVAVIVAPLVCGTLGERVAWHWGFDAAGAGMLIGLLTYLAGRAWLPPEPTVMAVKTAAGPRFSRAEWRTLALLTLLLPVLAVASLGNMEIYNAYMVWAARSYALVWFGETMPVSWLLSLDAMVSIATLSAAVLFWRWWGRHRRQPDEIVKMACGAALMAAAPLVLACASWQAGDGRVGLGWALAFHVINDLGFASFYPVGLSLYSRMAPPSLVATVVNAFSLHLFLANLMLSWLAGLLGQMSAIWFWSMHAAFIGGAALTLLGFARPLSNFRDAS